jgi:hypothetical protein
MVDQATTITRHNVIPSQSTTRPAPLQQEQTRDRAGFGRTAHTATVARLADYRFGRRSLMQKDDLARRIHK